MSRSALHFVLKRQMAAGAVPSADPFAETDAWQPDEERLAASAYTFHGNTRTFNMEAVLAQNIVSSNYFRHELLEWPDAADLLGEARSKVTHLEPWAPGGAHNPSPAFCILYRLALTRLTRKELTGGLLQATPLPDAALLRGLGLLYLRYTCPPDDLWTWFAPALEDGGAVPLSPGINAASSATTLAAFARRLLSEPRYGGSQLPPVPVKLKQEWAVKLMLLDRDSEREAANARAADAAPALLVPGARVRARYSEDEKWYDAVVDGPDESSGFAGAPGASAIAGGGRGAPPQPHRGGAAAAGGRGAGAAAAAVPGGSGVRVRYWVTYAGFGDSESVRLGRLELGGGGGVGGAAAGAGAVRDGPRARRDGDAGDGRRSRGDDDGGGDRARWSEREGGAGRGDGERAGRGDWRGGVAAAAPPWPRRDERVGNVDDDRRDRGRSDRRDRSRSRSALRAGDARRDDRGGGRPDGRRSRSRSRSHGHSRGHSHGHSRGRGDAPRGQDNWRRSHSRSRSPRRGGGGGGGGRRGEALWDDRGEAARGHLAREARLARRGGGGGSRGGAGDGASRRSRSRSPPPRRRSRSRSRERWGRGGGGGRGERVDWGRDGGVGGSRDGAARDSDLGWRRGDGGEGGAGLPAAPPPAEDDDVDALRRRVQAAARAGAVVAEGSRDYGARPAGVNSTMSARVGGGGAPPPGAARGGGGARRRRSRSPRSRSRSRGEPAPAAPQPPPPPPPRAAPTAEALARLAELRARYGDDAGGGAGEGGGARFAVGAARDGDEDVVRVPSSWAGAGSAAQRT